MHIITVKMVQWHSSKNWVSNYVSCSLVLSKHFHTNRIQEKWDQVGGAQGREGGVSADGWGVTNDKPL